MLALLAVFIAILALAYFTYRNLVGLDTRLRKIEDILRNAEVVTTTDPASMPSANGSAFSPINHRVPNIAGQDITPEYIAGWGGQGPVVKVDKDQHQVVEETEQPEEVEEDDDNKDKNIDIETDVLEEDDLSQIESQSESETETEKEEETETSHISKDNSPDVMESVDDILKAMEVDTNRRLNTKNVGGGGGSSIGKSATIVEMKDALKKAGVPFSTSSKKADLQKLMDDNNLRL